jgi:S-methylmethionine-dependent homocysteine/selenocysteine methylase
MNFTECVKNRKSILMEGALGERLKREYNLTFDEYVVMAGLIYSEEGRKALRHLWTEYADIAAAYHLPFLATTPTRRTNKERVEQSCFDASIMKANVDFLREVQSHQSAEMYVGGLLGCRGDAYTGQASLGREESECFHEWEVDLFAESKVDFLYAALMPAVSEAAGMALAIEKYKIPYIISFTIKEDGCLIDGTSISDAIQYIDSITTFAPACYMTNCVHPQIVYAALSQPFNRNERVSTRFLGIQANTSPLPYDKLDNAEELKTSEPELLADEMIKLREISPIKIFGGCCGTDGRHMAEIAKRM